MESDCQQLPRNWDLPGPIPSVFEEIPGRRHRQNLNLNLNLNPGSARQQERPALRQLECIRIVLLPYPLTNRKLYSIFTSFIISCLTEHDKNIYIDINR